MKKKILCVLTAILPSVYMLTYTFIDNSLHFYASTIYNSLPWIISTVIMFFIFTLCLCIIRKSLMSEWSSTMVLVTLIIGIVSVLVLASSFFFKFIIIFATNCLELIGVLLAMYVFGLYECVKGRHRNK